MKENGKETQREVKGPSGGRSQKRSSENTLPEDEELTQSCMAVFFCLQQCTWKQFSKSSPESGLDQGSQEDEDDKNHRDEPYLQEAIVLWHQNIKDWKYTCW